MKTFTEALEWLYGTQMHGIKLGLENVRRLIKSLSIHVAGPEAPTFLHVAGTNGKGSVCAMLDSIRRAAGKRTGLFTSPHLVTFRERIRLNGAMIDEESVVRGLDAIRTITAGWEHSPTFFEIATALSLQWFQQQGAEIVVLETGMGGRLDATNVVTPAVSVITPIDLDHQRYLGDTLAEIAFEKGGIIKPGVPVVSAPQHDEAMRVLMGLAGERGAPFQLVEAPLNDQCIGLAGSHQRWNAAVAVRALEAARIPVGAEHLANGLRDVQWPGRFQRIDERTVLDGAHNGASARQLQATWREEFGQEPATVVLGVLADKDAAEICRGILPIAARVIVTPVRSPRDSNPRDIMAVIHQLDPELPVTIAADLPAALAEARASSNRILIMGSLFLVGEAIAHIQGTVANEFSAQ